jgi:predicted acylesterase/phospholipase RssA
MTVQLRDGFTLALGGGGARGWAHVGVARALERFGLRPTRIVGTSMGAVIGAALAAGRAPDEILAEAARYSIYRLVRRPGRFALFDPRPLVARMARDLGDPRIEDLPLALGISTYDLVSGRPFLITRGSLANALERSIAVPLFFPPKPDGDGVWTDAGPWESMPVSLARAWSPELPIIGVHVDAPKPPFLASRIGAAMLRRTALRLGIGSLGEPLTARRYLALLANRWADPVAWHDPDLLIAPRLGWANALQFSRVGHMVERGERDANLVLAAALRLEEADADAA